ncbi:exocyst complex component 3-like protein 4 [Sinocyclocheilus rhinocerous]|uniref:exocyst complex component 3-like protein 4 n=1 Tax=Sinocyclocheilus rhinocerous TaxID=307959 RepID=UPI0007BAC92C|nr:PREDICTED: exocyst complex component 3-like protein 4 [Sinocyclocheilus rhinocerous]
MTAAAATLKAAGRSSESAEQRDSAVEITGSLARRGASIRQSLGLGTKKHKQEPLEPVTEAMTPSEEQTEVIDTVLELRDTYTLPEIPPVPLSDSAVEITGSLARRGASIRQSLGLGSKKHKQEPLEPVTEAMTPSEEQTEVIDTVLELRDTYTLPEIPPVPLSVMEINKLIDMEVLEEAYVNLLSLCLEFQKEHQALDQEDYPIELVNKEKDLSLLYGTLRNKMFVIVRNSSALPSRNKELLVYVAYIILEEEKRQGEPGAMQGWRETNPFKGYDYGFNYEFNCCFHSEKVMGSSSLQPELKEDQRVLTLDNDFLNQIKDKYCACLQADMKTSLNRIIELENEDMWREKRKPVIDEGIYTSHIDMDIWTNIKGHVQGSRRIDVNLEQKVVRSCLEELKTFPKRFESAFVKWSSPLSNSSLWAEYHISYINSFSALKEHMESYQDTCPIQLGLVQNEIDGLTTRLSQAVMENFKTDVKPFLRRQMTGKWFSFNEDFSKLISRTETLSDQSKYMTPKHKQAFVNKAHFFVVKEYVSQLMKNNYSCKNRKNETAATKITNQWEELKEIFQDMNSTLDWLHPVGNQLSMIIGCKKSDVKQHLQPLVNNYPDIRKSHLSAVLYFRGIIRGREKHTILQRLAELKQSSGNTGNKEQALFSEIQAAVNTDCMAGTPFSCLSFIVPDS